MNDLLERVTLERLSERLAGEDDVKRVVKLVPDTPGRFLYLIETPFATFPKFVIGTTDATFDDVRLEVRCGAEWNALKHWGERTK